MKKGEEYTGIAEALHFPNKGVVRAEGTDETVLVKNVLPGQTVRFRVSKKRGGKMEGRLLEVIAPSPLETRADRCVHFPQCGGCQYQALPYEEQLELKARQVEDLIVPVIGKAVWDAAFEGALSSPREEEYRNKMEFSFGDTEPGGPLTLGLHCRGSFYDVLTVDRCRIVDADFRRILTCTRDYFAENGVPFYHRLRHTGYLRHLVVRKAAFTGEILVNLVTASAGQLEAAEDELLGGYAKSLAALELDGRLAVLLHTQNDRTADVIEAEKTDVLYPDLPGGAEPGFTERLLGLSFQISAFSFFQTNSAGAEVLYGKVREYVMDGLKERPDSTVYDLYSGTGTIAQMLAPAAKKVIGVEIVEEAVAMAKVNAAKNGLANCEFIAGDVLKVLSQIEEKPDMIVLDPPRDGVHPKALSQILSYGVEQILYISCKPTSLARDLVELLEGGFRPRRICCVDMFPWTSGIETAALLVRKRPDGE